MERRSRRGQDVPVKTPPAPVASRRGGGTTPKAPTPKPVEPQLSLKAAAMPSMDLLHVSEIPEVGCEEIVLNRRGMPIRQRKRNRFYFDDDMITPDKWGAAIAKNAKKVKAEPLDDDERDEEDDDEESSPNASPSPPKQNARGRFLASSPARASASRNVRGTKEDSQTPSRRSGKVGGRSDAKTSPVRGGRGPTLQLHTVTPDRKRGGKSPSKNYDDDEEEEDDDDEEDEDDVVKNIKSDPDGPPLRPFSKKALEPDRWGKLVQRANKLGRDREERAEKKNPTPTGRRSFSRMTDKVKQEVGSDFDKSGKRDSVSPRSDKDKALREKEKKQAILKEKEQERAKERALKEKKAQKGKESKREHRDSISVLPSVVKPSRNQLDESHQSQSLQQQNFLAVIKIDDSSSQGIDKRIAHDISIRLRNLLKLPKAHKWVCYEWFYSNIDKVLFEGENDFQICLKESFPTLKARKLTRTEWTKIRRLMGKPRRCSQAFFDEEREELSRRRAKIRQIQQRKVTDFSYKELPDEIPLQLVIGTKVTARLRRPQDGLFTGTIEGVDTSNNTYRITFDRPGLGTHSIPDYEVLSNDLPETVSTSSFALKIPRRSGGFTVGTFKFQNPALLGDQPEGFPKSPFPADGMLGGFPIRLLDMIVRLSKLLKAKREKIMTLKELNVEAEKMKSYGRPYNAEYRTRYARCVLDLDSMNKEMGMYLEGIQTYCLEITNDHGSTTQMVIPEHILDSSRQEASMVVSTYNYNKSNRTLVHNQKIVSLVHQLTSLILQVRALSTADRNLYELKSLKDTIRDVKASLEGRNLQCFQNKIEIPMNRIIAGLCVSQPKAY